MTQQALFHSHNSESVIVIQTTNSSEDKLIVITFSNTIKSEAQSSSPQQAALFWPDSVHQSTSVAIVSGSAACQSGINHVDM